MRPMRAVPSDRHCHGATEKEGSGPGGAALVHLVLIWRVGTGGGPGRTGLHGWAALAGRGGMWLGPVGIRETMMMLLRTWLLYYFNGQFR